MLMYNEKDLCPYIFASSRPWLSVWCFSGMGRLPQIIMIVSSPGKGVVSPLVGDSSISMPRGRDPVVMKLFIRPQSRSFCLTE
jgi:hypothetical protein